LTIFDKNNIGGVNSIGTKLYGQETQPQRKKKSHLNRKALNVEPGQVRTGSNTNNAEFIWKIKEFELNKVFDKLQLVCF
jgi:hypothetical protein